MPLYEYRCGSRHCGISLCMEGRRKASCPLCGQPALRQPSDAALVLCFSLGDFRDQCGPISLQKAVRVASRISVYDAFGAAMDHAG